MSWWLREPERDPALGNALRRIEAAWKTNDPAALQRRIVAAARPRLAPSGSPAPRWWELISAWNRIVLPVGLAASLAAGVLVRGGSSAQSAGDYSTDSGSDSTLVLAAFSEPASGSELTGYLIAPDGNDWLLEQAVAQ